MAKKSEPKKKNAKPNYITQKGLDALQSEYDHLYEKERPELLKVIQWAAENGDRSEANFGKTAPGLTGRRQ